MIGIAQKRVWITGAASGIGLATAQRFGAEGARLFLVDITDPKYWPQSLLDFNNSLHIQADLMTEAGCEQVAKQMEAHGVDVLINNAGITRDATLAKMTMEHWNAVISVNLTAVFRMSQVAGGLMKQQNSGVILNAASVVAHNGNFGQTNYVASKAGVIGLTKALARELGKYGIRVNAVAPGFIETPMVEKMRQETLAGIKDKTLLRRLGHAEDIAAAYAFLASDDATYITGTCLNVDGGLVL